jgi:hypothetical protein
VAGSAAITSSAVSNAPRAAAIVREYRPRLERLRIGARPQGPSRSTEVIMTSVNRVSLALVVIGIARGREAKAYPISIMGVHELGNDTIDRVPIAVSWYLLCQTHSTAPPGRAVRN